MVTLHHFDKDGEVKKHTWFSSVDWVKLSKKSQKSPFIPNNNEDNFESRASIGNDPWKDANSEAVQQSTALLGNNSTQDLFRGYFYDIGSSDHSLETIVKK